MASGRDGRVRVDRAERINATVPDVGGTECAFRGDLPFYSDAVLEGVGNPRMGIESDDAGWQWWRVGLGRTG